MSAPTVDVTKLLDGCPGQFGPRFLVKMSDDSALSSPVTLNVANGNALMGFVPTGPALKANVAPDDPVISGAGFIPDGTKVRVTPFTAIVVFHGRERSSHRESFGRSSITAPIAQIPPRRKQTVGG